MKKIMNILVAGILIMMPAIAEAQNYSTLWKQVKTAQDKDLPKSEYELLRQIADKAEKDKAYGQLLKAEMQAATALVRINSDSLTAAVSHTEQRLLTVKDKAAKAVYAAALARLYQDIDEDKAATYRQMAVKDIDILAKTKAGNFAPAVIEGNNANIFGGDLLSVVCNETRQYLPMYEYYNKAGNRRAACIAALKYVETEVEQTPGKYQVKKSPYVFALDSVMHIYEDLDVAGEVAIARYNAMKDCKDVTTEDKIAFIHYALDKWGEWQGMGKLRNAERTLTRSHFSFRLNDAILMPDKGVWARLDKVTNVNSLTMSIYRTKLDGSKEYAPNNDNDLKAVKQMTEDYPVQTKTVSFGGIPNYAVTNDSIWIDPLPVGVYLAEISTIPATETRRMMLWVSGLRVMVLSLPGNKVKMVVVDATTGQPVGGAKIDVKPYNKKSAIETLTCDEYGEATYTMKQRASLYYYAYTANDRANLMNNAWSTFNFNDSEGRTEETVNVFTDRSIYRPGQKVSVAAIAYAKDKWTEAHAIEGRKLTARIYDANGKVIDEQETTTDSYGTCHVDFNLPEAGLTGQCRITVGRGSAWVSVEEYKRPTFKVEFPEINTRYQAGDTLAVQAKALSYAGVPVQGAKVSYRVWRHPSLWWSPMVRKGGTRGSVALKEETTITDGEGRFDVNIPLVMPDEARISRLFYNFTVEADVTDISGETRHGEMSIPLGSKPTAISSSIADKVMGDSLNSITIYLKNQAGINVNTPVKMSIDNGSWLEGRTMTPITLPQRLASGKHHLYALCDSDTLRQDFTVFNIDDTKPAENTDDWFFASADRWADAHTPVTIQVGSSRDNCHIVYSIIAGNKVIESGRADISNALINRKIEYKDTYDNGLLLTYAWVKDGKMYSHSHTIHKPLPDNRLNLRWTTFRDRLRPGQSEQWTLNILDDKGKPADAQLMATMYDASLDQLKKHNMWMNVSLLAPLPFTSWQANENRGTTWIQAWAKLNKLAYKDLQLSYLDKSMFAIMPFDRNVFDHVIYVRGGKRRTKAATPMMAMAKEANVESMADFSVAMDIEEKAADDASAQATDDVIRENFQETAFFYPAIIADKKGNAIVKFTLPETLTSWRFMGLAHTRKMQYGMLEGETVAQKEVMVQPNMPRFVRLGDKTTIAAKIFNTGNAKAAGTAHIELSDPETGTVIMKASKPFEVDINKTTAVVFDFAPEDNCPTLLVCKMTAEGKCAAGHAFADGEQHYLPVLPDNERVTVTTSFTQTAPGITTIKLADLWDGKDTRAKMTMEYTDNPAWMAVQTLPAIAAPKDNNAIDLATAVYANVVGRHIAGSNPKIRQTFCAWKEEARQGGETMLSNLARNAELKDLLLNETPWMADDDKEEDIKRRLADFFDDNTMNARIASATEKLARLQNDNGAWSWWPGMRGSTYMTAGIMETLVRMETMAGHDSEAKDIMDMKTIKDMEKAAANYLDREITKEVKEMKNKKSPYFSSVHMKYLYANALAGRTLQGETKAAADYLITMMKKEIKTQSLYDKAMAAVILARHGDTKRAAEYVKSLKEYSTYKENMGRYFENARAEYSWQDYRIPTQVAAMEAIRMVTPKDTTTLAQMKRWLLQEKRTQAWDTPVNSVNATYALLTESANLLSTKPRTVIAIDGKTIDMPKATAGMGYVKTATGLNRKMKAVTFDKTSEGTSWGAVYAQSMQRTQDIKAQANGISVKREVITPKEGMKVGSKVTVRITVTAERDLDFVQVIDRRAACMQPVEQLSGYRHGYYCTPKDNTTNFYFDRMSKGRHVIETEYYIDRKGTYRTGSCTAQCTYAPEFRATDKAASLDITE